jgi:CelD/BcsL family acetyltransferase involved in cellulose biosynthesis
LIRAPLILKSRIIRDLESLSALRPAWTKLEQATVLPMQQFIWSQACAETFACRGELRLVVLEDGSETVAIAPLVHRQGSPCLEFLGVAQLFEPADILYSNPEVLSPLASALVELGIPLHLRRFPADSPLTQTLQKAYHFRGVLFSRPDGPWPWITLDSTWAEPENKFNSKRRAYLHRARRIAEEFGTVSTEVLTPTPATLAPLLDEAFAVEAASWKGKSGTALAMDPVRGDFYRRYATAACEQGILRLCFLRIGGRAAAMQLGVETHNRFWLMKIGYDEQFAPASPGNLLVLETVRYTAKRGLKSIAFLGAMEPWKQQWTSEENPCVVLRGYPLGWRGATTLASDLAKSAWHKLERSL